jgi:hypothetical protein
MLPPKLLGVVVLLIRNIPPAPVPVLINPVPEREATVWLKLFMLNVPAAPTVKFVDVGNAFATFDCSVPPLIVVFPVYVLLLDNCNVFVLNDPKTKLPPP